MGHVAAPNGPLIPYLPHMTLRLPPDTPPPPRGRERQRLHEEAWQKVEALAIRSPHYPAFAEEGAAVSGAAAASGVPAETEEEEGPIDPEKIKVEAKQVGMGWGRWSGDCWTQIFTSDLSIRHSCRIGILSHTSYSL